MLRIFLCFSVFASLLISCGTNTSTNGSVANGADSSSHPPVETQNANTDYKPAFKGQTRIAGTKTSTPWQAQVLTTDLKKPWGIAALPDGRFLITEKAGAMRIATATGQLSQPITGIPAVDDRGQGGLLGLTIDPKYANNKIVYWAFSERGTGGTVTAIAKGNLSADEKTMQNTIIIYRAIPAYNGDKHYGGRLLFDTEGNLVISTGERSDLATRPQAQDLKSALGKIIRINTDGKPAAGNPYLNNTNALPEIFSYGHRNTLGLAMHPQTKELWNSEMGPRGGDEINILKAGINYGWPTITYGIEYGGAKINNGLTQQDGLEQPVYYWDPVLSPGGMTFYSGDNMPEWSNNLFIGGLSSKHIARLVIVNNKVTAEERLLAGENQRFRDVTQGSDGILYAITDEGRLYKIAKK